MQEPYKKILEKQLERLSKETENNRNIDEICKLTEKMVEIIQLLDGCQSQSFYAASTNHPYVVQLPVGDLIDLYVAKAQLFSHQGPSRKNKSCQDSKESDSTQADKSLLRAGGRFSEN